MNAPKNEGTEPLPAGTPSATAAAAQDPPPTRRDLSGLSCSFSQGSPILTLTPASHHLLAHARTLVADHPQFAVVFAHAACELHTEYELARLLNVRTDAVLAELLLPDERDVTTLANSRVSRVYTTLTDDYPMGCRDPPRDKAHWWDEWHRSRKDRHAVAHTGAQMTGVQATAAIAIADKYIMHVTEKVEAALARLRSP